MLPACAELAQAVESVLQLLTAGRQRVDHLRARRRLGLASQKACLLQTAQPLGQHLLGNSRDRSFESAKVKGPVLANPFQDAGDPTASHDVQGASSAAVASQLVLRQSL